MLVLRSEDLRRGTKTDVLGLDDCADHACSQMAHLIWGNIIDGHDCSLRGFADCDRREQRGRAALLGGRFGVVVCRVYGCALFIPRWNTRRG